MLPARLTLWFERRPLLRFVLSVIALLPACFIAWYYVGASLAAPSALLADWILAMWPAGMTMETRLQGTDFLVLSAYGESDGRFYPAVEVGNQLAYPVNTRVLSYSMPFFTALYLATPMRAGLDRFAWCFLALWLLLAVGLVATTLKNFMLGMGEVFLARDGVPPADAIALAYQFSTLMVPPLAPVLLWAWTAGDSAAFRGLFTAAKSPDHAAD